MVLFLALKWALPTSDVEELIFLSSVLKSSTERDYII